LPHPYALIDLPSFDLQGKYSLFAAHRLADGKNGQLVTFELEADALKFSSTSARTDAAARGETCFA
jgi:hypothetical protein